VGYPGHWRVSVGVRRKVARLEVVEDSEEESGCRTGERRDWTNRIAGVRACVLTQFQTASALLEKHSPHRVSGEASWSEN